VAVYLEEQGYCSSCRRDTLARGRGVNHVLHLLLSFLCCAVWPFVWGALCLVPVDWRCSRCGDRVKMPAGFVQVLGFVLLGLGVTEALEFQGFRGMGATGLEPVTPTMSTGPAAGGQPWFSGG